VHALAIAVFAAVVLLPAALVGQVPLGRGEVLILLGPPGSGKTLQARKLSRKYKIPSISVPDVLREQLTRDSLFPSF